MSHRYMAWTQQVAHFESGQGHVQVQPGSFSDGGTGSNLSNQGVHVGVVNPGNTTNVEISYLQSYYGSITNQQQHVQNLYPYIGVDPSSAYTSSMYNPSMLTTAANRYFPYTQSFGLSNPLPAPLYHQTVAGTMGESSSSSSNFGDSNRDFIKRKNAVTESDHHSVHGFASSSSSAHVPQNPSHGPWGTSFESHVSPNAASAAGPNMPNLMAANPEFVRHGNYVFPAGHMSQSNQWIAQAANGIADGVPHREYNNAVVNPPGNVSIPNGNLQEYQAAPSAIFHWHVPHFSQIPVHNMQTRGLYNHIQLQGPQGQTNVVHGVNPSAIGFTMDPRIHALSSNAGHTFGPPAHQFHTNQVNNGSSRILPYEHTTLMELSRLYEARHVIDEHLDMGLDIDSMTYEELVALEEQIGYVNTGLTESYILENLRSFYAPGADCMPDQSSMENDACIICQEEYEARELVGALDCGHKYHAGCIKQWLMVKNLCPICKTTAFSADQRNGD